MRAVSAEVMQQLDRQTIEIYDIPGLELMERAGAHVAETIELRFSPSGDRKALILAGKGNNGGDGFVVARLLAEAGWQVTLLLFAEPDSFCGDAKINYQRLSLVIKQRHFQKLTHNEVESLLLDSEVIVDALFGTGLTKALSGVYAEAAQLVNSCDRTVVAVDIPSGVDATSGKIPGVAIKSDITVTFGVAKP